MSNLASEQRFLLLGEGEEEVRVFKAIFKHLGRTDIKIEHYGGKEKLHGVLKALPLRPDFRQFTSIIITRDADNNPSGAFDSVCSGLRKANLPIPTKHGEVCMSNPKIGVFVLPDGTRQGMLEDLFWDVVVDRPEISCIDSLFSCLKSSNIQEPSNMSKAKMNVWLAIQHTSDKRLGEAALSGYFPLNHPSLQAFIQFIQSLAT
jgi:hypothetical protein